MTININPNDFATLAICAIRYCHGRRTYMPSLVQDIVRSHLGELNDKDLSVLLRDCEWMTDFDFGDPKIDRPRWEQYRKDLETEKTRRSENESISH